MMMNTSFARNKQTMVIIVTLYMNTAADFKGFIAFLLKVSKNNKLNICKNTFNNTVTSN